MWVNSQLTAVYRVLLGCGMMTVSRKGMDPSGYASSTVSLITVSNEYMW